MNSLEYLEYALEDYLSVTKDVAFGESFQKGLFLLYEGLQSFENGGIFNLSNLGCEWLTWFNACFRFGLIDRAEDLDYIGSFQSENLIDFTNKKCRLSKEWVSEIRVAIKCFLDSNVYLYACK